MAGDWIKMRIDLQSHPKVVRIMSAMRPHDVQSVTDKFRVVGGLHAVWGVFDTHSEDGVLRGYTPEALDHIVGWDGLARAMESVGWLVYDGEETLTLPEFTEHNGQSAKRRAEDQKRKRDARKSVRNLSGNDADKVRTKCGPEKRREEKKEKEPPNPPSQTKQKQKSAITFKTWIASIPEGQKAIPADHHVFAYADSVGLPRTLLVLAWRWFERRYADEPKRYRDWPTVFRKAVEGNWGKLWFLTADGDYQLTTVGRQFERSQEAE